MSSLPILQFEFESFIASVGLKIVVGTASLQILGGWHFLVSPYTTQSQLDRLNSVPHHDGISLYFAFYPYNRAMVPPIVPAISTPQWIFTAASLSSSSTQESDEEKNRKKKKNKRAEKERRYRREKRARENSSSSSSSENQELNEPPGRYAVPLQDSD